MMLNKYTRVISAFPGTGKSHFHECNKETTLDSDSSLFSWIEKDGKKVRNPNFPDNYIQHIRENIGKYDYIFVSSHKEVREALRAHCIFFYVFYPHTTSKNMYIQRYKDRGSPEAFIKLISDNWYEWLKEIKYDQVGCKHYEMSTWDDMYLYHEINRMLRIETTKEKLSKISS